ncbi:MAG: Rv3654c family TadE-like protein [Phycicoccus sp.]
MVPRRRCRKPSSRQPRERSSVQARRGHPSVQARRGHPSVPARLGRGSGYPSRESGSWHASRERGSGSVLASGVLASLVLTAVTAVVLAAVVRDVRAARVAADLAALAAAAPLASGGAVDCAAAVDLSAANGARVESCTQLVDGSTVVAVTAPRRGAAAWLPLPATVSARARAGLAPPSGPRRAGTSLGPALERRAGGSARGHRGSQPSRITGAGGARPALGVRPPWNRADTGRGRPGSEHPRELARAADRRATTHA